MYGTMPRKRRAIHDRGINQIYAVTALGDGSSLIAVKKVMHNIRSSSDQPYCRRQVRTMAGAPVGL